MSDRFRPPTQHGASSGPESDCLHQRTEEEGAVQGDGEALQGKVSSEAEQQGLPGGAGESDEEQPESRAGPVGQRGVQGGSPGARLVSRSG